MAFPLTRKARTAPLFVEEPVVVEPQPRVIPGLDEARKALEAAQENASARGDDVRNEEKALADAEATLKRLRNRRVVNGIEDEAPGAEAAANAAIAAAEERVRSSKEAERGAQKLVEGAKKGIARVWRAEAGRRSVELARAVAAARALVAAIAPLAATLETKASELARASNNTALPPDDIENALAQAAKVEAALRLAVSGSNA